MDDVAPTGVAVHRFDGSWFDLRHQMERSLAGQDVPRLVAYLPTKPSDPDPLEELRAVGARFRVTLPALLKSALAGQLTEQRLAQVGEQCSTLPEAEAALDGGDAGVDARLISTIGETSTAALAAALIAGTHSSELAERDLVGIARQTLAGAFGADLGDLEGDDLRHAAFRQVVLSCLVRATGDLPSELAASHAAVTPAQTKAVTAVVERLQTRPDLRVGYVELAQMADEQLHLATHLGWSEGLSELDVTPAIEQIVLTEAFRLLETEDHAAALSMASERLKSSWWLTSPAPGGDVVAIKYRAVRAIARLELALARPLPPIESVSALRDWYTADGY
ncbi:MAG: hypothetical protein KC766_12470, partial [Myxococcales bacterium]|nr:hypothetical protein [Myxococcales bacterium]